jgi:hypothetical protein
LVNLRLRAARFLRMRTPRGWSLANTWIWGISGRCSRFVAEKSGFSYPHCFGTAGRSPWSRRIGLRGMRSFRVSGWESFSYTPRYS